MTVTDVSQKEGAPISGERWRHLILAVLCMILIANMQYGWSVFVLPLHEAHKWALADIQFAFTLFVALETWATPLNGSIADRLGPHIGPRVVIGAGGILLALGWIIDSYATSLPMLYVGGALAGLGSGAVYCTSVGVAVKWFKDHRGLAVGLVAGGFGAGTALTIIPIQMTIAASGYASAFFWFGLIQGGAVLILSQFIRNPNPGEAPDVVTKKVQQTSLSYTPSQVLRSPVFWVLYILDVLMCAGGLVVTAYLAPIAADYHISEVIVLFGATTLSFALIFSNVMNGIARPFFGWVSDEIGLSQTMAIAFALGACSYFCLYYFGPHPWGFILFTGMVFFCWGEIFSLFPAMCTDLFGTKYATTNTSMLYTAKGVAAFLVPVGGYFAAKTGSWNDVLLLATAINIAAFFLVLFVLWPEANRHHEQDKLIEEKEQQRQPA